MSKQVAIVVIGGGFAGCAAACAAARAGADVTLVEKSDALSGLGQIGGSFRQDGFFAALEEMIAMGAGDMPKAQDAETLYTNVELKHQHHVSLYDSRKISKRVDTVVRGLGVNIMYRSRATNVEMSDRRISKVKLEDGREFEADAFVEATGTCGPMAGCKRYGNGCVSCVMGCPTFGGRVSIAAKAGVKDMVGVRSTGKPGGFSAALTFSKESLAPGIQKRLEETGELKMPLPKELIPVVRERIKELAPNLRLEEAAVIQLTDIGFVNMVGISYLTLEELQKIPGFENVVFVSPHKGWIGNSIRYLAVTPRDNAMKVEGLDNLFVAGEKAGGQPMSTAGAIVTGVLAGHNAVRKAAGMQLFELPRTISVGYFIAYTADHQRDLKIRHTLGKTPTIDHIYEKGIYTTDVKMIHEKVEEAGLTGIFSKKLV